MLVDDNREVIEFFKEQLEEKGYFVAYYEDWREAVKYIEEGSKYDLAIPDIRLEYQRITCNDIINISKRKNPDIPIMTLSAHGHISKDVSANPNKFTQVSDLVKIVSDFLK